MATSIIHFKCPFLGRITLEKIKSIPANPGNSLSHDITYYINITHEDDKGIYFTDINGNMQYLLYNQVELISDIFINHIKK